MAQTPYTPKRGRRGFQRTSALVQGRVRTASESRGFAESRLLTHWAEIAGEDICAMCRPLKVTYGRGGLGATLTLLTTGAQALMLEMQLPKLREKVNACYGYNAIAKIKITQTAPTGFAEGQATFLAAAQAKAPVDTSVAEPIVADIADTGLRAALASLGANVIHKSKCGKRA